MPRSRVLSMSSATWRSRTLRRACRRSIRPADASSGAWLASSSAYKPAGKVIRTGATSGRPASSWICACLVRGMSRGFPRNTWPL